MIEVLPKLLPINIIITSYNRLNLLKCTIDSILSNTVYPYKIFVVDSNSNDGSVGYLKECKVQGKVFDTLFLSSNEGQSCALNKAFYWMQEWESRRPSDDLFITTNDDLTVPLLRPCWLEQLKDLFERHEENYVVGGVALRVERTARTEIDESKDLIRFYKNFPSVYRMLRRSDFAKLGEFPFRKLNHWDSNSMATTMTTQLKKRFYLATHLYCSHIGFVRNKGYSDDIESFTVAENKVNIHEEKPYPDIDPETNIPLKINHSCDASEQKLRDDYHAILEGKHVGPEVTLLVLTCKRPDGLKRILDSIKKTTTDVPYKLLVVADNDDHDAYTYCIENGILCILSSERRDFVAQANLAVAACDTPYFVILADDMSIEQQGWLTEALKVYKERFPDNDGLMAFNDGIQNGRLFACGMSSKKFVYEVGSNLYHPSFIHFGGDNVTSFLAKEMGCYHYAESVKVVHHHPTNKNPELANPSDATYKNSEMYNHFDQQLKKQKKSNVELLLKERNYCDYL